MDTESKPVPQVYKGHRNLETVKGENFFGPKSEYIVSGSDCGRIFIWRKKDGELLLAMEADKDVVNCIGAHPHMSVLASSGIESDIKIWTPKAEERATLPINIESRPRQRRWNSSVSSQELLIRLCSLENWLANPDSRENSRSEQSRAVSVIELGAMEIPLRIVKEMMIVALRIITTDYFVISYSLSHGRHMLQIVHNYI